MDNIIFTYMENKIEFRDKKDEAYKFAFKKNRNQEEWLALYSDYIMKSKQMEDVNIIIN